MLLYAPAAITGKGMSNIPCLLNFAYQEVACLLGQPFNIYRPPYGLTVNQGPSFVGTIPLSVKPGGNRYAIPQIAGVNYFTITGDRSYFQPGDVIQPVNPNSTIPSITVLNYDVGLPCIGFRTSRLCTMTLDIDTSVYTNIYFDYIAMTTATHGLIEDLSGALNISHKKGVMYARPNILPQFAPNWDISGMRLIESDGTVPVRLTVQSLTTIGSLIVLNLDQEVT